MEPKENSTLTTVLGAVVLLIIILIGGALFFNTEVSDEEVLPNEENAGGIAELCGRDVLTAQRTTNSLANEDVDIIDSYLVSLITDEPSTVNPQLENGPAPGAVAYYSNSDEVLYVGAAGVSNIDTCERLSESSQFQIGSNTKMFTSAIIFQLIEEELLSLDSTISTFIENDFTVRFENYEEITIGQLLSHTSGLADYLREDEAGQLGYELLQKNGEFLTREYEPLELIELASGYEPNEDFSPNSGLWNYSNTNYILLGLVIETVTGNTYEEELESRIFKTLGLERTYLQTSEDTIENLPSAYLDQSFDFLTSDWNPSQGWAAGAIISTPSDFEKFVRAYFDGDLFEQESTVATIISPVDAALSGFSDTYYYGYGMFKKDVFFGHGGQTPGFQSDVGYNPETGEFLLVWTNSAENSAGNATLFLGERLGIASADPILEIAGLQRESANTFDDGIIGLDDFADTEFSITLIVEESGSTVVEKERISLVFREDESLDLAFGCSSELVKVTGELSDDLTTFTASNPASLSKPVGCEDENLADTIFGDLVEPIELSFVAVDNDLRLSFDAADGTYYLLAQK